MNMLAHFNEAMDYIEKNLMCDIEPSQISHIAGCSEYHFRRMFSFLSGMPLGEYIRRRQLYRHGWFYHQGDNRPRHIQLLIQLP